MGADRASVVLRSSSKEQAAEIARKNTVIGNLRTDRCRHHKHGALSEGVIAVAVTSNV